MTSTNVNIRLASERIDNSLPSSSTTVKLYTPGQTVSLQEGFMK